MGLQYRAIRAASTAVLVAATVGMGGSVGLGAALAADPGMVGLSGVVVDGGGAPLAGVHLRIVEELGADGGVSAIETTTGADGAFSVDVFAWGTVAAPAMLTIATPPDEAIEVIGPACSQTWGVALSDGRQLALADGAPDPLTLTATTSLLGEVCGATATPPVDGAGGGPRPTRTPADGAGNGSSHLTPPPTDVSAAPPEGGSDRIAPALTIGFVGGLVLAVLVFRPGRQVRRRE